MRSKPSGSFSKSSRERRSDSRSSTVRAMSSRASVRDVRRADVTAPSVTPTSSMQAEHSAQKPGVLVRGFMTRIGAVAACYCNSEAEVIQRSSPGRAKATKASPARVPILPAPPAAITTNCLPPAA